MRRLKLLCTSILAACILSGTVPCAVYAEPATIPTMSSSTQTTTQASTQKELPTVKAAPIPTSAATQASTQTAQTATTGGGNTVILQPAVDKPELSLAEQRRWTPDTSNGRKKDFLVNISSETNRIEVFYTAGKQTPQLQFVSPTGKYTHVAGKDEVSADNTFKFITRSNLTIPGYDNMRYMVIYIKNTPDPGKWTLKVSVPDELTEIACVTTDAPDGWEDFNSDMRCKPTDVWFWFADMTKSDYRQDPVAAFNEMWAGDNQLGDVDNITTSEPTKKDYSGLIITTVILISVIIICLVIYKVFSQKKTEEADRKDKRQKIVDKENHKVQKKKQKEEAELSTYLDQYSKDYDDDDFAEYFKDTGSDNGMDNSMQTTDSDNRNDNTGQTGEESTAKVRTASSGAGEKSTARAEGSTVQGTARVAVSGAGNDSINSSGSGNVGKPVIPNINVVSPTGKPAAVDTVTVNKPAIPKLPDIPDINATGRTNTGGANAGKPAIPNITLGKSSTN